MLPLPPDPLLPHPHLIVFGACDLCGTCLYTYISAFTVHESQQDTLRVPYSRRCGFISREMPAEPKIPKIHSPQWLSHAKVPSGEVSRKRVAAGQSPQNSIPHRLLLQCVGGYACDMFPVCLHDSVTCCSTLTYASSPHLIYSLQTQKTYTPPPTTQKHTPPFNE